MRNVQKSGKINNNKLKPKQLHPETLNKFIFSVSQFPVHEVIIDDMIALKIENVK